MPFEVKEWPANEKVGSAYAFEHHGKFHGVLETNVGSYRGNHVHPVDQYTLLLKGKGKYVLHEGGERRTVDLVEGEVFVAKAGVPHILVPEEDCFTFEWWDGDFVDDIVSGLFDDLVDGRVGPKD